MLKTFCKKCGKEGCRAHPRAGVRTFRMEEVGAAGPKKRRRKARKAAPARRPAARPTPKKKAAKKAKKAARRRGRK